MELNQIRYFLAVAETQKVTATAEKLHIAQPALTQSIHRLEKELGVPLFRQKGRNIVITAYGKYLQKHLLPIIDALDALPRELSAMAHLENETIHISMLAASSVITAAIIAYKKLHPAVSFQLMQSDNGELYDILVTTSLPSERLSDPSTVYFREKINLAVPHTAYFAGIREIRLSDVANEGFIQLGTAKQLRNICDVYCRNAGFQPKLLFESDNPYTVRNLIGANMGIGFWPAYSWGNPESGDILLLPITEPECTRDIVLSRRDNKADNGNVRDFFFYLTEFMSRTLHTEPQLPRDNY